MKMKKTKLTALVILLLLPVLMCFLTAPTQADAAIAKVSSFKGDVLVQSGDQITQMKKIGYLLNSGDFILTKQGEAQVIFNDGAVMKLNAFSKTMIQEGMEKKGWIFKTTQNARRVTCFVGKLWFKSGASNTQNYLQTPTAVAGIRGSDGEIGFDNVKSYLNMFTGEARVVGDMIRGFFENPGITAAQKSAVYQSLSKAYEKTEQAKATGKTIDIANAKVDALKVAKDVAVVLQTNPDPTVKNQANLAAATVDASISAATAKIAVERIKEAKADATAAEKAAARAAQAAEEAKKAADRGDLKGTQKAAEEAKRDSDQAEKNVEKLIKEGVIKTTVPTTVPEPTTTVPKPEDKDKDKGKGKDTTVPTTAPMTTIETTTSTSTTTTSTTSTSTVKSPSR